MRKMKSTRAHAFVEDDKISVCRIEERLLTTQIQDQNKYDQSIIFILNPLSMHDGNIDNWRRHGTKTTTIIVIAIIVIIIIVVGFFVITDRQTMETSGTVTTQTPTTITATGCADWFIQYRRIDCEFVLKRDSNR